MPSQGRVELQNTDLGTCTNFTVRCKQIFWLTAYSVKIRLSYSVVMALHSSHNPKEYRNAPDYWKIMSPIHPHWNVINCGQNTCKRKQNKSLQGFFKKNVDSSINPMKTCFTGGQSYENMVSWKRMPSTGMEIISIWKLFMKFHYKVIKTGWWVKVGYWNEGSLLWAEQI